MAEFGSMKIVHFSDGSQIDDFSIPFPWRQSSVYVSPFLAFSSSMAANNMAANNSFVTQVGGTLDKSFVLQVGGSLDMYIMFSPSAQDYCTSIKRPFQSEFCFSSEPAYHSIYNIRHVQVFTSSERVPNLKRAGNHYQASVIQYQMRRIIFYQASVIQIPSERDLNISTIFHTISISIFLQASLMISFFDRIKSRVYVFVRSNGQESTFNWLRDWIGFFCVLLLSISTSATW